MTKNIHTFIGCDCDYDSSKIVIFGAPFDGTTSYRPGTRFAPSAMRNESFGLETYSPYKDMDLEDALVFDGGDLELPFGNTPKILSIIQEFSEKLHSDRKIPCMIGGEHLVTLAAVRAALKFYPDLYIVHFDAHADFRHEYLGETLSHATVMRRCYELLGEKRIFQFGIRSGDREEYAFAKTHSAMTQFDFTGLPQAVSELRGKNVYFSIDLDVLDPSAFCGTGTPEAGGVTFLQLIQAMDAVCSLNVVACDINELAPVYDQSGVSTATACKVLRELLLGIEN